MQNRDKHANDSSWLSENAPLAPPLADADIRGTSKERSAQLFRNVAKGIGIAVCTVLVAAPIAKQVDTIVTNSIWPQDTLEVSYIDAVAGTEAELHNEAFIAFPGVGQKDTENAATEHFRATNSQIPVAYVSLPNQGFTIPELAEAVDDLIDEKQLQKINIIGVSAGTQLALQTISYIEEHPDKFIDTPGEDPLPEVGYFLANSSPYDVASAYKGPIIEPAMTMLEKTNYRSGVTEKFIYSLLDGPGDVNKILHTLTGNVNARYIFDSIEQTFNNTAPRMVQDHLQVLHDTNAEKEKAAWKKVLTPTTRFLYFYPSKGKDVVVDNENSYRQFSETLQELDVSTEYVPTESGEHADTVQAAVAFGNWVISLQETTGGANNPYPDETARPSTS